MTETLPAVEQKNYTPLLPLQSRLILYVNKNDSSFLDPRNKFNKEQVKAASPLVSIDILDQTFTIIEHASIKERKAAAGFTNDKIDEAINVWAEKNAKVINKKKGVDLLRKIFGVKAEKVSSEDMVTFYKKYFQDGDGKQSVQLFVHDVVSYYIRDYSINIDGLKRDINTIQSLAGAFGSTSSEVITQLVEAEVKFMNNTLTNLDRLSQEVNNITPGDDNERLLKFLTDGERLDAPKPIPTTRPPTTEPPQEGLEKNMTYALEDLFRKVKEPVDPNHKYFVKDPLETIPLTDEQIQKLIITKPFYRYESNFDGEISLAMNSEVVPFFHDLKTGGDHQNKRFEEALELTNGESILFGLTAGSSTTIEKQAKLFKSFSQAIIEIHQDSFQKKGEKDLIQRWIDGQKIKETHEFNSYIRFENDDSNRPENEKLLVDSTIWASRLTELSTALKNNKLLPHHLRWIEFLAHSVDVTKLVEMNQAKKAETQKQRTSEVVINDDWTVDTIFKNYAEASNDLEEARNAVTDYQREHGEQNLDTDKRFKELNRIRMKKTFFAADYHTALFNIEDVILPEILGVTKDSFSIYQLESAIIDYITYKFNAHPNPDHIADLTNEMNSLLMSINQEAKKTIPGFKPTTVDEIIRIHEIILKNKLTKIKDGTWKADIKASPVKKAEPPAPAAPKPASFPTPVRTAEPAHRQGSFQQLGDDLKRAGADFVATMSKPENLLEVASHLSEHAQQHVGSLEAIITKVSESRGGVVELSTDSRGLTEILPKLIVDSLDGLIKKKFALAGVILGEEPKRINISHKKAATDLVLKAGVGPLKKRFEIHIELNNNSSNSGFDRPLITINPQIYSDLDLKQLADDYFSKIPIDQLIKKQLQESESIKDKTKIESLQIFFTDDDQVHLKIHTKAP